ncbi:MAG: hypothetical protein LZF62_220003 [Nitrospira sp.]|nr:MAG: hypothetical protein LZF62_220003 [Nitrospira sp.]
MHECIEFCALRPQQILRSTTSNDDSPNVLAFDFRLDGIHPFSGTSKVRQFKHDDTNRFAKFA